ncbi:hypothetical protein RND71_040600 [Anisodus tanguticus]|uniref:Ferredoxin n=1 Tax=Anisodus tanguticus TaxID=243964 RepID=A0AAE1QUD7_9SOLA|nr:hypothetical protein RND71_040600 [Anisodus tanguticus]
MVGFQGSGSPAALFPLFLPMVQHLSEEFLAAIADMRVIGETPLACNPRTSYAHLMQYPFTQVLRHEHFCTTAGNEEKQKISVTFVDKDGEEIHIKVPVGMSMLEAAYENDIELEGDLVNLVLLSISWDAFIGCVSIDVKYYNKLEDPTDDENDVLDFAFGLSDTSRLGCQVIAKPELDGIRLALPVGTRNFAVDDYKPKPH